MWRHVVPAGVPRSRAAGTATRRVSALKRHRAPDDPAIGAAERDLRALNLADHARRVAAELPPLTKEQRDEIISIIAGATTRRRAK